VPIYKSLLDRTILLKSGRTSVVACNQVHFAGWEVKWMFHKSKTRWNWLSAVPTGFDVFKHGHISCNAPPLVRDVI